MSNIPYSYHTFLFPFIWKTSQDIRLADFEKILSIGTRWIETSWHTETVPDTKDVTKWMQDYQAFQYFTKTANNAIFDTSKENVVKTYSYKTEDSKNSKLNGEYSIVKGDNTYKLVINNIRLNIYDVGVAILIFEMENHDYRNLDSVNAINEHGRRVNFPFLISGGSHTLCADEIRISFDGVLFSIENFLEKSEIIGKQGLEFLQKFTLNYIMQPIQKLLDNDGTDNGGYEVTAHESHKSHNKFYIKPCVDDRMFVCCVVCDESFSKELQGLHCNDLSYIMDADKRMYLNDSGILFDSCQKKHDDYMNGWSDEGSISSRLYKLLFIENESTCQDNTMKKELLTACVYRRWVNAGTLYGVTHHSLLCINKGDDVLYSVIIPFLIEYVQMAILVLAQRSAILLLEDEAARVADSFNDANDITSEQINAIERLQARYVKTQNQLLLSEVTVQEQGVEIYEMLWKQLYIEKNMADLNNEMDNLRDVANIANERLERKNEEEAIKARETENRAREAEKQEREKQKDEDLRERERQKEWEDERERQIEIALAALGGISVAEPLSALFDRLLGNENGDFTQYLWWTLLSLIISLVIYKVLKYYSRKHSSEEGDNENNE